MAGQEGFEPPSRGFGDRCSSRWSYWPLRRVRRCASLHFLVTGMFAATPTVLFEFQAVRCVASVLGRGIIPFLTIQTRQRNDLAHRLSPLLRDDAGDDAGADGAAA